MKKILILFFISTSLYGYVENLEYLQAIVHYVKYEATLLEHNGRLYVDAIGAIEEYNILPDGSLDLNSYINKYDCGPADAIILGDTLYVANQNNSDVFSEIFVVDISGDEMELLEIKSTNSTDGIFRFGSNNDYFVYKVFDGGTDSIVLDRTTLEYVTQLSSGGYFSIRDTLLFKQMNYLDSVYVFITDISDIYNPVEISSLKIGENQQNIGYFYYDNLLFITQNTQVVIIDISDLENPELVATIDDMPGVPFVNFFTTLIIYGDYLMFGNQETKFWIYDISNIYTPVFVALNQDFVGGSTYKRSLLLNGDDIYYARSGRNICHIDTNCLPSIEVLGEYGNMGQIFSYSHCSGWIFHTNIITKTMHYFKFNEINPDIYTIYESYYGFSLFCHNDSLLCFTSYEEMENKNLNIVRCTENEVALMNSIDLGNTNFKSVDIISEHLILRDFYNGLVKIYKVMPDYSISLLHETGFGTELKILNKTSHVNEDYIYFISTQNNFKVVNIVENQLPFEEVGNFNLNIAGYEHDDVFLLSEDRIALIKYYDEYVIIRFCSYIFPDEIELLNTVTCPGFPRLHDNCILTRREQSGLTSYYTWNSEELTFNEDYDFGFVILDNFFFPEMSKLYAVGRYNIQEYTCDYVSIEDNTIPQLESYLHNYPNPFNPETRIVFNLPEEGNVKLDIYNIKGQKVKTLLDCYMNPGRSEMIWNGKDDNGKRVSSGVYFYQLITEKKTITKKMILIK